MKSLNAQGNPLAQIDHQLQVIEKSAMAFPRFHETLTGHKLPELHAHTIDILQVNVGLMCNMTCTHCHVDAGPDRKEIMPRETVDACLRAVKLAGIKTIDLTGGAPEMNPEFRYFVKGATQLGCHVIDRCNLTILTLPKYKTLPKFLAKHKVEIVASLPCYIEENTDSQRGDGVFAKSIEALKNLNSLGYGLPGSELNLTLVYNPIGANLPPDQASLEEAYREQLAERFGISFSRLITITNMPINRFLDYLLESEQYEDYMKTLVEAFNPASVQGVMCRSMLSVAWDGTLHDCDFNQMLEYGMRKGMPKHIADFDAEALSKRTIITGQHCYGCTAGAGSGCQGSIS